MIENVPDAELPGAVRFEQLAELAGIKVIGVIRDRGELGCRRLLRRATLFAEVGLVADQVREWHVRMARLPLPDQADLGIALREGEWTRESAVTIRGALVLDPDERIPNCAVLLEEWLGVPIDRRRPARRPSRSTVPTEIDLLPPEEEATLIYSERDPPRRGRRRWVLAGAAVVGTVAAVGLILAWFALSGLGLVSS